MFVNELPAQFETVVGVGGEKLSGGQVCRAFPLCVGSVDDEFIASAHCDCTGDRARGPDPHFASG
jgi:hypothetical protein